MDTTDTSGPQADPAPSETSAFARKVTDEPRHFDDLSILACGVLVVSGSVLAYALVPWFGFSEADSVAAHLIGRGDLRTYIPFWDTLEAILTALE